MIAYIKSFRKVHAYHSKNIFVLYHIAQIIDLQRYAKERGGGGDMIEVIEPSAETHDLSHVHLATAYRKDHGCPTMLPSIFKLILNI